MKKPSWIRLALIVIVWIAWERCSSDAMGLRLVLQGVFNSLVVSAMYPRFSFWRLMVTMAFAWVMGWLANASGLDEIPGLVLSVVAVGIFAFLLFRRRPKPLKTEVLREGNDLVFSFRRGMRQREPIPAIASYRFDSVWHLQLMMKDQTSRRIELPSLSWKPVIQKLMAEAGIPVSAG